MFMGVTPTILRPLSLVSAILKPQDVFAILAQPANAMQAAINALPFPPDLLIGKDRVAAGDWSWRDSLTGLANTLASNTTAAQSAWPGYSGTNNRIEYAFKQQAGVIVRVTWTGDGTSNRLIPHGLGVVPGMVIVKRRDGSGWQWWTSHRSLPVPFNDYLALNSADQSMSGGGILFNGASATAFTVSNNAGVNASGGTYVGLVIAHDPSADGIVQCGGAAADGAGTFTIPHGWAGGAQWVMFKRTDAASDWIIADTSRTAGFTGADALLRPNTSGAETSADQISQSGGVMTVAAGGASGSYIWAIIRAPY